MPLHTEYRVFVDFDTKEILGASPYWRSDVMKNEFKKVSSPQERHDYVVYKMHEDILNQRYHESVQTVLAELKKVIPRIELTGQWSVDVMRNGNDYYIIDMALAENSALNDCVRVTAFVLIRSSGCGGIEQLILLERNFDSGSFSKKRRNQNHTK